MPPGLLKIAATGPALPRAPARSYKLDMVGDARDPARNDTGLKQLLLEMRSELTRFLLARRCDPADVEDILHDLYVKLSSMRSGPISNPKSYLFEMANNLVHDRRRGLTRQQVRDDHWARSRAGFELERDPAASPEQSALDRDELERVQRALDALPERTAEILKLYRVEGQAQKAIAQMLGLSLSAVEKHLQRAYRSLLALRSELDADPGAVTNEVDHASQD